MSGDSGRRQSAISYPVSRDDSEDHNAGTWARFGWLAAIVLVVAGAVAGSMWNKQESSPSGDSRCDEIRRLAHQAEQTAVATLVRRNVLQTELDDVAQFLTPAYIDRVDELGREIPAQESRVVSEYSGWEDALNSHRECFVPADLIFAQSRIRMVHVLFG